MIRLGGRRGGAYDVMLLDADVACPDGHSDPVEPEHLTNGTRNREITHWNLTQGLVLCLAASRTIRRGLFYFRTRRSSIR